MDDLFGNSRSWIATPDVLGDYIAGWIHDGADEDPPGDVIVESRVMRLKATDSLGRPVPGLRVRLSNLQNQLYPQLPDSYHIVTCSLNLRCAAVFDRLPALYVNDASVSDPDKLSTLFYDPVDPAGFDVLVLTTELIVTMSASLGGGQVTLQKSELQPGYRVWYGEAYAYGDGVTDLTSQYSFCLGLEKPTGEEHASRQNTGHLGVDAVCPSFGRPKQMLDASRTQMPAGRDPCHH